MAIVARIPRVFDPEHVLAWKRAAVEDVGTYGEPKPLRHEQLVQVGVAVMLPGRFGISSDVERTDHAWNCASLTVMAHDRLED